MWDRVAAKTRAKNIIFKNYWWAVLVAVIITVVGGGRIISFNLRDVADFKNVKINNNYYYDIDELENINSLHDLEVWLDEQGILDDFSFLEGIGSWDEETVMRVVIAVMVILIAILIIIAIIYTVLKALLLDHFDIGGRNWFLLNRTGNPNVNEVLTTFKTNYGNVTCVMLRKGFYILLWGLLFVVPGIIKSYEYRMIPYLLAENPNMSSKEAFSRSRQLMTGRKMELFVLDLSFIGWRLLSMMSFGILGVLYVDPYIIATETEFYVDICQDAYNRTGYNYMPNGLGEEFYN